MTKERDIDRLYALPLSEFTAARNELAKRLRTAGKRSAADRVKALAKPSRGAWVVNQLYRREREAFDRLMAAGAAQRRAITRRGAVSRKAAEEKRGALAELLRAAEAVLEAGGGTSTRALRQRITRTLESLAAQAPRGTNRPGRLTVDLQPSGFDALLDASISAAAPRRPVRQRSKAQSAKSGVKRPSAAATRRLDAARGRVREAKSELATARRKRSAAAKEHAALETRAAAARKRSRAAELRAEEARRRADELELAARRARSELDTATRAVARLETRLEGAARQLEKLS